MLIGFKAWLDDLTGKEKKFQRYGEKERRKQRIAGQLFSLAVFVAAMYYIIWCCFNIQWKYWYMAIPFLITEFAFLILFILWASVLWNKRFHRPEGLPIDKANFSVDIFIPVCREPIDLIETTVAAAAAIHHSDKVVYVLDDGEDETVRMLCDRLGVNYLRRPSHENRKAGNLNYGLAHSHSDLILALDADQVPHPEIINRIMGYFTLPKIGFVQTKQNFKLPKGDPWGNADSVFYEVMQPGKDYDNAAISCGSGVMYRRSALDSIGGFSTWNFVEDLYTSQLLHNKGWRSVYHGVAYTTGTAPDEVISHVKQRWQWAVDSLRIFYWDNPLFNKGLSFYQKVQYFHFGYHYFVFGFLLPIFFILPIWALFTHEFMLREPFWRYFVARLPYLILYMFSNKIVTDKLHSFKIFQAQANLFAVYFRANIAALSSKNSLPQYTVTEKVTKTHNILARLKRCLPHIIIVTLTISAAIYGIINIKNDFWFLIVNLFWASWSVAILWRFIMLSLFSKYLIR
jgi:cellulose synthase (UDP-forming)